MALSPGIRQILKVCQLYTFIHGSSGKIYDAGEVYSAKIGVYAAISHPSPLVSNQNKTSRTRDRRCYSRWL